jgi:hypothetical protein
MVPNISDYTGCSFSAVDKSVRASRVWTWTCVRSSLHIAFTLRRTSAISISSGYAKLCWRLPGVAGLRPQVHQHTDRNSAKSTEQIVLAGRARTGRFPYQQHQKGESTAANIRTTVITMTYHFFIGTTTSFLHECFDPLNNSSPYPAWPCWDCLALASLQSWFTGPASNSRNLEGSGIFCWSLLP